ncbi:MAG: galactokinase [FCB group bacterium]|nr:galactokinase [FCB group bacterium]
MILVDFMDTEALASCLRKKGLDYTAARKKAELFAQCARNLREMGLDEQADVIAYFVPGRIEILGKHTDYVGGRSIVAALERGFCVIANARDDQWLRICNSVTGDSVEFAIHPHLKVEQGRWTNYPMTVARRLARNFTGSLRGANIAFSSDLPGAAGMSSSSAMMIMFFFVLSVINQLEKQVEYRKNISDRLSLAEYLAAIENGRCYGTLKGDKGVGTLGGSEDHTAILCSRPGYVGQFSYCPARVERYIAVPDGYIFVIGSSGVVAQKTGSAMEKYNRASRMAQTIWEVWQRETGRDDESLSAWLANDPGAIGKLQSLLGRSRIKSFTPLELKKRLEHFVCENEEIVGPAGEALVNGELSVFGKIVDRSQEMADKLLENQIPETVYLARSARELGAVAATAFGAGFGGAVWALVKKEKAETFLNEWFKQYEISFPKAAKNASFFQTQAGPAAFGVG